MSRPNDARSVGRSPLLVVLTAVALNVASGIVLKAMADQEHLGMALLAMGVGAALCLNGIRFLLWTYAHKRYPLSSTYPLTSLFFPVMLGVAYLYGRQVGFAQWVGTMLITGGVVWLAIRAGSGERISSPIGSPWEQP